LGLDDFYLLDKYEPIGGISPTDWYNIKITRRIIEDNKSIIDVKIGNQLVMTSEDTLNITGELSLEENKFYFGIESWGNSKVDNILISGNFSSTTPITNINGFIVILGTVLIGLIIVSRRKFRKS
jgi:hypothetical protein